MIGFRHVSCSRQWRRPRGRFRPDGTAPQLTYRTGIDLVQVDVYVLDKDRHPVHGLKPGDSSCAKTAR